jgi:hypothetical protein
MTRKITTKDTQKPKKTPIFLQELKKKRDSSDQTKNIIKFMVENCIKNIRLVNSNNVTQYLYEVPSFLLGYPLYDIQDIATNVNSQLKKKGLKTIYTSPNKIYVTW